jgi:hypothetical protein
MLEERGAIGAAPQFRPDRPRRILHLFGAKGQEGSRFRSQRVCGNPRSTLLVAGSGQRDVTTLPWV